ncbi:MAG: type II secretion system GspH family protein [Acidimicrobiia bacterium]|nr:type II secretion system GspH family protein [Acidimicrobiia bacterium]
MRPRAAEGGFTLVELLVTIAILGLISGPLAASIIVGLRSTDTTRARLGEANDTELLGSYLVPDVQGARLADTAADCGGATVLRLTVSPDGEPDRTLGYHVAAAGDGWELRRRRCEAGAAVDDRPIVHELAAAGDVTVAIAPDPAGWRTVTVTVDQPETGTFELTGSRRWR